MARPIEHGMSYTPTYASWHMMWQRCTNPNAENYANYGGRGITVCDGWRDFNTFWSDMGTRPAGMTLDRENTDGPYTKSNCKWATLSEQQRNKRPFKQPEGRTYGEGNCSDCGNPFTKMGSRAKRCPPCLKHARRYHRE